MYIRCIRVISERTGLKPLSLSKSLRFVYVYFSLLTEKGYAKNCLCP